jgi:hypothetical protein
VACILVIGLFSIPDGKPEEPPASERVPVPRVVFRDITQRAHIGFLHRNGSTGRKLLPETMGSGVAVFDYNNDGHQDILFINSCDWPGARTRQPGSATMELYENDGHGHFTNVTARARLDQVMYGMGVTVGDFDNDGYPDLFITGVGGNRLYRNVSGKDGAGKAIRLFEEVTRQAGLAGDPAQSWPASSAGDFLKRTVPLTFASSAAFLDYDGDGWLDLFVCNYVTWSPKQDMDRDVNRVGPGKRSFAPPDAFSGSTCLLFRNRGRDRLGRWLGFEDVTRRAGIAVTNRRGGPVGKSLGVAVCDVDGDGHPDILVANDTTRNFFFHNQGDGTFKEIGLEVNAAWVEAHNPRGGMGIDTGEYRPGSLGAVIGNFAHEPDTLLVREWLGGGRFAFQDRAGPEGLADASQPWLKFGVMLFDYDLDGRLDLLTCNGQLELQIKDLDPHQSYQQPVQLFWNTGRAEGAFALVPETSETRALLRPLVGRGCAYGDFDGDGFIDVVLTENGGPARLLRNEGVPGHHRLRLVLKGDGRRSNTSAIGAKVILKAGDTVLYREVVSARGYLSQSELPVTFGLGKSTRIDQVEIRWPGKDGGVETLKQLKADMVYVIGQHKKPVGSQLRTLSPRPGRRHPGPTRQ